MSKEFAVHSSINIEDIKSAVAIIEKGIKGGLWDIEEIPAVLDLHRKFKDLVSVFETHAKGDN